MEGRFKGWIPKQSHGYIIPEGEDEGNGILLLNSEIQDPESYRRGVKLSFDIILDGQGRRQATNTKLLDAGPLLQGVGTVIRWNLKHNGAYGFVRIGQTEVYVSDKVLPAGLTYLSPGDQVNLRYEKGEVSEKPMAVAVKKPHGWQEPNDPFDRFAEMGDPRNWLMTLALMAEYESWDFHAGKLFRPILQNYIRHTFRRLQEMPNGIGYSANKNYAAFNTGLVTRELEEDIFAAFEQNGAADRQPWRFCGFHKPSSRLIADSFGSKLPPLADYYENPSCLLFDRRFEIIPDYEHIFEHMERWPERFRDKNKMQLKNSLIAAIQGTKIRAARNNQVAVAQYFRDGGQEGQVQLLLPLSLEQTHPPQVDLALVLGLTDTGDPYRDAYRGHSVLTLDMAYSNARLLMRPESRWLDPEKIDE